MASDTDKQSAPQEQSLADAAKDQEQETTSSKEALLENEMKAIEEQAEVIRKSSQTKEPSIDPSKEEKTKNKPTMETKNTNLNPKDEALLKDLSAQIKALKNSNFVLKGAGVIFIIILAIFGVFGFKALNSLQAKDNLLEAKQIEFANTKEMLQASTQTINSATQQINALIEKNSQLQDALDAINTTDGTFKAQIESLSTLGKENTEALHALTLRLQRYESQNPDDWRLAECYFLVNNAMQKAVFDKNVKAAIWFLNNANLLIAGIEDNNVINIRQAIHEDITTLSNLESVDRYGINIALDEVYKNIDNMILRGYSDPTMRQAAFKKETAPSSNLTEWKDNLLNSVKEFSSRFIEVRRKDAKAATEFLTPSQDVFLRENIKTRVLLAKADINAGDSTDYSNNLNEALSLVTTYFDEKHPTTQTVIKDINELKGKAITPNTPTVLKSSALFNKLAKERVLNPLDAVTRGDEE